MTEPRKHERRHPAHGVRISSTEPTVVFLTVCTKNRLPWLATEPHHSLLRSIWFDATAWRVGRYVLMPDHLHLFAEPGESELPLDNWVRYWKSQFSKSVQDAARHWQSHHWDTRMRRGESYAQKWDYVRDNPVRKGLASSADEWPLQGEIHELDW